MPTTEKLDLSITHEADHDTLTFNDWRYLQDGDDNNSNTKKIDDFAVYADGVITSACANILAGAGISGEDFLLLSENSRLPNASVFVSGCGLELHQQTGEVLVDLNLNGDPSNYEGAITITSASSASYQTTVTDTNRNFGVSFILGDGVNPIMENSFVVTRAPYGFDITQYDIFLDAPHEVEGVLEVYNSGSSSWDYAMTFLTYGARTYWESEVSPAYTILEDDVMRLRCITPDNASMISITLTLIKDL